MDEKALSVRPQSSAIPLFSTKIIFAGALSYDAVVPLDGATLPEATLLVISLDARRHSGAYVHRESPLMLDISPPNPGTIRLAPYADSGSGGGSMRGPDSIVVQTPALCFLVAGFVDYQSQTAYYEAQLQCGTYLSSVARMNYSSRVCYNWTSEMSTLPEFVTCTLKFEAVDNVGHRRLASNTPECLHRSNATNKLLCSR